MNCPATLPPEMAGLKVRYVQRKSATELSSSCPFCGGEVHPSGEWPDRFKIFLKSKYVPVVVGWCRNCGKSWYPNGAKLTPEQETMWLKERQEAEEERLRSVKRALELLRTEKRWLEYRANMTGELRQHYYARKIDDYWIEYWNLGYTPARTVNTEIGEWTTPALTIPVFEPVTKEVLNMRYRLLNPPNPHDKYRPEYGLPSSVYATDYDKPIGGKTLVVEGEFKSMTTYITLDDSDMTVVGLPGKSPGQNVINQLKDCDPIYLCLDPDADVERVGLALGRNRVRVIELSQKIDDMIIKGWLDQKGLQSLMKTARKI